MHTTTPDSPPRTILRSPAGTAPAEESRIRLVAFWVTTTVVLLELTAGATWNLLTIDWVEAQLSHLRYPDYFAHILGVCHVAAAVAIAVPGFRTLKEWAYAGTVFMWSGAAVSHLSRGDGPVSWAPPLMFLAFAAASWALRPADRRTGAPGLRRDRWADTARARAARPATRPRAWAASIGLLVAVSAVSLLTLPAAEDMTAQWPAERGWVDEQRP